MHSKSQQKYSDISPKVNGNWNPNDDSQNFFDCLGGIVNYFSSR